MLVEICSVRFVTVGAFTAFVNLTSTMTVGLMPLRPGKANAKAEAWQG